MNTSKTARFFFALILSAAVAVGCSDANASEATYLPVHEPCPFDAEVDAERSDSHSQTGVETDDEALDLDELDFDDQLDTDLWIRSDAESGAQRALFSGNTAPATRASNPGDASGNEAGSGGVDINSANADELTELPGIGPALAERIVEYRQSRRFENASQLQRVDGIGPSTLENIASLVRIE